MRISILESAGAFAENKDQARRLRTSQIMPSIRKREGIVLDFDKVTGVTQSFVHALIAQPIRLHPEALDLIVFENCNDVVKAVIEIVVSYSQEEWGADELNGGVVDHPAS